MGDSGLAAWDFLMLVLYRDWRCEILEKERVCHWLSSPREISRIWQVESIKSLEQIPYTVTEPRPY